MSLWKKDSSNEASFRLGHVREQRGDMSGALHAYQGAVGAADVGYAYRLSAVARCAALYEARRDYPKALAAYRDIMRNSRDPELVAAATDRASQISRHTR